MTSAIDTSVPPTDSDLLSAPVRNNFVAAAAEITALQASSASDAAMIAALQAFQTLIESSAGSDDIGFIQAGTGAEETTVQANARLSVNVFQFMTGAERADVMAGTALLDVSGAFVDALATGQPMWVPAASGWVYGIGTTITVPMGAKITSQRAKLRLANGVNNHVLRIANGADDVEIDGLAIDGNRSNNTGGHGIAMGGTGGTNIRVTRNYVHDCSGHGIYLAGSSVCSGINVSDNYCYNNYSGGITGDSALTKFAFERNFSWNNGTYGVGIFGIATNGAIVGNVAWDNGQGTPTADNFTGYNAGNSDLTITGNVSLGGLNNGMHFGGNRIDFVGNTAYGAQFYGIVLKPNTGTCADGGFSGNGAFACGYSGFDIENYTSGVASGNRSSGNTRHGFLLTSVTGVTFTGNTANNNILSGYANSAGQVSSYLTFTGNSASGNGDDGLLMTDVTNSVVCANQLNGNGGYGINGGGAEGSNLVTSNFVRLNTTGQIATLAATTSLIGNDTGAGTASTGTGPVVLQSSPTLVTPVLGAATATSINKVAITAPAAGATLAISNGKTFAAANSITVAGTDGTVMTFPGTSASIARIDSAQTFVGTQVFGLIVSRVASGGDAVRIQNSSLTGTKAWEFYPLTNGTDTDLAQYEFATSGSGIRVTYKAGGDVQFETGNLLVNSAGKGLRVKEGSNAKQGTATLVAGAATVANTSVTANSRILVTSNVDGGTPGWLRVSARVAGTSFTITSSSATDTSTVAYEIFEPA